MFGDKQLKEILNRLTLGVMLAHSSQGQSSVETFVTAFSYSGNHIKFEIFVNFSLLRDLR